MLQEWTRNVIRKITTEMQGLLEDLTRLLKRSGFLTNLSLVELAGYSRRDERLRELCKELSELA